MRLKGEMKRRIRAICGLVLLVCVACDEPVSDVRPLGGPENADDKFLEGQPAASLILPNRAGGEVSLETLRGKVVMLNVWATWCAPCLNEMPALERLYQILRAEGLEIVAVNVDSPGARARVDTFIAENALSYIVALDPKMSVPATFGMTGFPETFFVGRDGKILKFQEPDGSAAVRLVGERPWDAAEYVEAVRKLLK